MFTTHLQRLLRWLKNKEQGEMIESKNYTRGYLGFKQISQEDLDNLCELANHYLLKTGCIGNSMGEIISYSKERITLW